MENFLWFTCSVLDLVIFCSSFFNQFSGTTRMRVASLWSNLIFLLTQLVIMFNFSLCTLCPCTYSWIRGHQTWSKEILAPKLFYSLFIFFLFFLRLQGFCWRIYDDVDIRVLPACWPCRQIMRWPKFYADVVSFLHHHYLLQRIIYDACVDVFLDVVETFANAQGLFGDTFLCLQNPNFL